MKQTIEIDSVLRFPVGGYFSPVKIKLASTYWRSVLQGAISTFAYYPAGLPSYLREAHRIAEDASKGIPQ